MVRQLVQNVI